MFWKVNILSLVVQEGWRWCNRCHVLFYALNPGGYCPAVDPDVPMDYQHDPSGSEQYAVIINAPVGPGFYNVGPIPV